MSNYGNNNTGVLFQNEKRRSENSPHRTGNCEISCPHCGARSEFWLSAWVKGARNSGKKFLSLAFSPKEEPAARTSQPQTGQGKFDDFDDDIPF